MWCYTWCAQAQIPLQKPLIPMPPAPCMPNIKRALWCSPNSSKCCAWASYLVSELPLSSESHRSDRINLHIYVHHCYCKYMCYAQSSDSDHLRISLRKAWIRAWQWTEFTTTVRCSLKTIFSKGCLLMICSRTCLDLMFLQHLSPDSNVPNASNISSASHAPNISGEARDARKTWEAAKHGKGGRLD